ncbi:SWI/SNF complex subunit SWI3A [Helianthus annuus]|uniref:Putative homeodomain-like protein n=1 Tax=Helianthus annuus TaxID=4232 RepID=A0A251TZW7_HELAN|nr:SWI/SNF complex subunit SWI3A [Helianthus annuus]
MEKPSNHQFLKPFIPAVDHRFEFELYTIPTASGWFSWDNIHDIEKTSLPEFFDGTSFTRNPRVYKEYRDFIISKYREDPSRRLTFSEVRKSLVGDVSYLMKVFVFLEKWGLINFGAVKEGGDCDLGREDEGRWKVKVEEGPPHGVRVVAGPNSLKPVSVPLGVSGGDSGSHVGVGESGFKTPPLASHSDVYQELIELVCASCKQRCESGRYEDAKDGCYIICTKCFKNESYGNNKSADDYKFIDHTSDNRAPVASWTESETLLLLESVLKHGDDWELVAQSVQTKSKQDCISKLLQLPFGHLMLRSTDNTPANNGKQVPPVPQEIKDTGSQHVEIGNKSQNVEAENKSQHVETENKSRDVETESKSQHVETENKSQHVETESKSRDVETENNSRDVETENKSQHVEIENKSQHVETENKSQHVETENKSQQNGDADIEGPPLKRICIAPVTDSSDPKMDQTDKEDEHVTPSVPITEEIREKDGEICEFKNRKHLPNISNSLMQQVAHISAMVGPHVTASAAEAAIIALCDENEIPREIFDSEENANELSLSAKTFESERTAQDNGLEMDARPSESEKGVIPLPLRMRAASATALGAAAAHAKLLAVQEDREIERLVSSVINTQLKKLQYKMVLLKEAEMMMEKEYSEIVEVEDSLLMERMDVVQKVIDRRKDMTTVKPQEQIIL